MSVNEKINSKEKSGFDESLRRFNEAMERYEASKDSTIYEDTEYDRDGMFHGGDEKYSKPPENEEPKQQQNQENTNQEKPKDTEKTAQEADSRASRLDRETERAEFVKDEEEDKAKDGIHIEAENINAANTSKEVQRKALRHLTKNFTQASLDNQNIYMLRGQHKSMSFTENKNKLSTKVNDPRVIRGMVEVAQAKGWDSIKIKNGHREFKRELWMEANSQGIDVKGYSPSKEDLKELKERRSDRKPNTFGKDTQASRAQVLGAIALKEINNLESPTLKEALLKRIEKELQRRQEAGERIPGVKVYDNNSQTTSKVRQSEEPSKQQTTEKQQQQQREENTHEM